jgi:putative ATP-binding cassette transporter
MGKAFLVFLLLFSFSRNIKKSRRVLAYSIISGAVAGIGNTVLIAVINMVLSGTVSTRISPGWAFVTLCCVVPLSGYSSELFLVRLAAQADRDLRLHLCRKIVAAPYRLLEQIGPHRLLAAISEDTPTLSNAFVILPLVITQFAVIVGCLAYLGWLSWPMLLLALGYMVVGIGLQRLPLRWAMGYFRRLREELDSSFKAIRAVTDGTKELKLNRGRRSDFFSCQLEPSIDNIRHCQVMANSFAAASSRAGQILFFIFLGAILFVIPRFMHVDHRALTGYALTVLFMIVPLTVLLNAIPIFGRAQVAAEKIKSLGLSLDNQPGEMVSSGQNIGTSWQRLDLVDVTHSYRNGDTEEEFHLGPLDLSFFPGELVFVIGGNGSGKTTLAKILMGLYEPQRGAVCLDGNAITLEKRDDYRQHFSAVFSDFYLFEYLFGISADTLEKNGEAHLAQLQLSHKVSINKGKLSTLELSQGQRKRLALLTAYLEDRPIYMFDEWASDQDPVFKEIFYLEMLPELKAKGKTVFVISHDDRYYQVADRLIKLERGQVEFDKRPQYPADALKTMPTAVS